MDRLTLENVHNSANLTTVEQELIRAQAIKAMRRRLDLLKPDPTQYRSEDSRAAQLVIKTLIWAKAFVPLVALLAAIASAVRTVQTASEIYSASGSHPVGVVIAAVAFTLATEGSLFVLALAQEGERLKQRAEKRVRRVLSLRSIWQSLLVRIGVREPARYDQLAEHSQVGVVIAIAFLFAVAANAYMGLRPLIQQIGSVSLQDFLVKLVQAEAALQMTFIVDMAAVCFPPMMALAAGHLSAQFAEEIAEKSQGTELAYRHAIDRWQEIYQDPLATTEGQSLVEQFLAEKTRIKHGRLDREQRTTKGERHETIDPLETLAATTSSKNGRS